MENINSKLIKNTIILFSGKVFTQLLSFLLLPLYTGYLSTEEYGAVDVIFTISSVIIPVLLLELDSGLFRTLIECKENREKSKNITVSIFLFVSIVLFVADFILFSAIKILSIQHFSWVIYYINATALLNLVLQYFRGAGDNIYYSILCFCNSSVTLVFNVIFIVVLKYGSNGMIAAYTIGETVTIFLGGYKIWKNYSDITVKVSFREVKKILNYSIPLIFNGISWWVMNLSDRIMINAYLGLTYSGIYAVSNKFSSVFFSAYSVFNMAWTETTSRDVQNEEISDDMIKTNKLISEALLYIAILIISGMYILFPILVDNKYKEGYLYIPILIIAVYFNCLSAQLGGILVALKRSNNIALTSLIGALVNMFINFFMIKKCKLFVASISTLISYILMFLLRSHCIKNFSISLKLRNFTMPALLLVICLLAYYMNIRFILNINLLIVVSVSFFKYRKVLLCVCKRIYTIRKRRGVK